MDWISLLLPGITGLLGIGLGGTLLKYLIFPKITKRTESAAADLSVLTNLEKATDLQGKALLKATQEKIILAEENSKLLNENYSLKSKISEYDFKIQNLERVTAGLQRNQNIIVSRLKYAEDHICINTLCEDRIPELGTYRQKDEKESM